MIIEVTEEVTEEAKEEENQVFQASANRHNVVFAAMV